jgi:hypothetical protein
MSLLALQYTMLIIIEAIHIRKHCDFALDDYNSSPCMACDLAALLRPFSVPGKY